MESIIENHEENTEKSLFHIQKKPWHGFAYYGILWKKFSLKMAYIDVFDPLNYIYGQYERPQICALL